MPCGNADEWCEDWVSGIPYDYDNPLVDPIGPSEGTQKVVRMEARDGVTGLYAVGNSSDKDWYGTGYYGIRPILVGK